MGTLRARLEQYGLAKYADVFAANQIDVDVLGELTDADLEKLGVPLGDRRRILKAAATIVDAAATPSAGEGREAERRQLTVMFADLVDSTKLAGRLDPEDMKDLIARYQKAVGDEITRFGGYVAKPLGDGLLIYFGWPQAHEDDAERAVRSGLAAVAAVKRLATPDGVALATRIGVATGEVVVGDFVGAGVDEAGAVVGETPNLAARLQSLGEANTVTIAEATLRLIGRQFAIADLGVKEIKGFDEPLRVWRVDGERAAASRFEAFHGGGKLGALIGRDYEAGFILERWQQAREGDGQLVLISGEAGIGKSRLVAEIVQRLTLDAGARILLQASPLHTNTALYPVTRQIEAAAGIASEDSSEEKVRKLAVAIPASVDRKGLALKYLADLMSISLPQTEQAAPASSDEQREATFATLVELSARAAQAAPLLVLVEDAHWLDATTVEYLNRLIDRLERRHAMVLITYRPEFAAPWLRRVNTGLLTLGRLGRRQARAMVDALMATKEGMSAETAEEIVAKSDGIPLFVEELTGSAIEASRSGDKQAIEIPSTLKDSLSARLDRLGSAKEVAQIASAIGREFSPGLVAAVLGRQPETLAEDLQRLTAIEVVFQMSGPDNRFVFKHALVQDAAYDSMLKSRRREVHAGIVRALERERPEIADTEPEVLASHLSRAGDVSRAAECWRKAGHIALRKSAYLEAIGAFRNALPLFLDSERKARADTHRAIALAYFPSGDHLSVREHLERAAEDAEAAGDQVMVAEIAMQQGHDLIQYGGSLTEAIRYSQRALDIATRLDDEALAYGARFSLGQARWITGNYGESIRVLTQNLPENLRNPERIRDFGTAGSMMMDSLSILGASHAYRGEFAVAFKCLERAEGLMTSAAFDFSVVQYHLNRAYLQRGDATTALPLLEKAVQHALDFGLKFTLPWLRATYGHAQALLGEKDSAIATLRQAIAESEQVGAPQVKVFACEFLAEALLAVDVEQALELAEASLATTRTNGYRAQEAELLRIKAAALAGAPGVDSVGLANEGLALARASGMRPEEGHALRNLGYIALKTGGNAAPYHAAARAIYSELDMPYWLARIG